MGYKVSLNCEVTSVTDVIHQVHKNFTIEKIPFHSDQGSQFASKDVVDKIKVHNWIQSVSRKGICWNNAVIESLFGTIKREELKWHVFFSFIQSERVVSEYINNYYMQIRPHSSLGGISPIQYILNKKLSKKTIK